MASAGPVLAAPPRTRPQTYTLRADPGIPGYAPAAPVSQPELVDAKVGDINGHPIYAGAFLAPLEARLIAEADRLPARQWHMLADREIKRALDQLVTDELLRAEALAGLNEEQRQGLRAFLENAQQAFVSENRGSERLAEKRLLESEGQTLEDRKRDEESNTLVRLNLSREIVQRVHVSRRDIEQRYERDFELYNPPPLARFRLIRAFTSETAKIAAIRDALASGKAFAEIASGELNSFRPDEGGVQEVRVEGEFADTEFFGAEALNELAKTLSPGQWEGPIEFGSLTGWLLLETIEQESTSLYDAQLKIEQELTIERRQEELDKYINRLIERARVGDLDEIHARLYEIAVERYGPRDR
ncbi:MAG: hypothetical protein DHS20C14_02430 [Phycisphaeraceae bacterium]|nr:MAG: hypothetical protein DHS20C14_02430 [Phycisphaeraceae bacterium]